MDFFGNQELARKNTALLVALYLLSIALIVFGVYAVTWFALPFFGVGKNQFWDIELLLWVSVITSAVIVSGSIYKMHQLSEGGGEALARMLGGARLTPDIDRPLERRLLNVVEEMAIASGLPVPAVFVLEQAGINAFAAGFSSRDNIIGVTRGAIEMMSRDELQGVIAHEFSHILNGDTRMKMRMMGVLYGIEMVGDIGIALMTFRRATIRHRTGRQYDVGSPYLGLVILGLLLFSIGTLGMILADFIKRAVLRQREYLADAAAVQFTRNPEGVAGALKVIGGFKEGSRINHAAAYKASHFFFSNALSSWLSQDWWATHPPLVDRIKRIDPSFNGKIETVNTRHRLLAVETQAQSVMGFAEIVAGKMGNSEVATLGVDQLIGNIGNPSWEHLKVAEAIAARIPDRLKKFSHEPYTARAVVYALLLDASAKARAVQLDILKEHADPAVFRETLEVQPIVGGLAPELRLPLMDIVLPTLQQLSHDQYRTFRGTVKLLIKADNKVTLFDYTIHRILLQHLDGYFSGSSRPSTEKVYQNIDNLLGDCSCVLAMLARAGKSKVAQAYAKGMLRLDKNQRYTALPDEESCGLRQFDQALKKLRVASPAIKKQVLIACIECVVSNDHVSVDEAELLRAVADGMGVPMPPFLPGQLL